MHKFPYVYFSHVDQDQVMSHSFVDPDPWQSLTTNFSYVVDNLIVDRDLLRRLVSYNLITKDEFEEWCCCEIPLSEANVDKLVLRLHKQDPKLFPKFCTILKDVGRGEMARRLKETAVKIELDASVFG